MSPSLIYLAGGKGLRFSSTIPKQYILLKNKPLVLWALNFFIERGLFSEIVVVAEKEFEPLFPCLPYLTFAQPGKTRQESVENGFLKLVNKENMVWIHDSARPLLFEEDFHTLHSLSEIYPALSLAKKATATFRYQNFSIDREALIEMYTPQILHYKILDAGFSFLKEYELSVTDDLQIAEIFNIPLHFVLTEKLHLKITHKDDLILAETLIENYGKNTL